MTDLDIFGKPERVPGVPKLAAGSEILLCRGSNRDCGTGGVVWPGAVVLCRWLAEHADSLRGKRVLELGCGTGLVGLYAAALGASKVTLTDIDANVLRLAEINAAVNELLWNRSVNVSVVSLPWGNTTEGLEAHDWILGADLVYQSADVDELALCQTLTMQLHLMPNCRVILSLPERIDTQSRFLASAASSGLEVETLLETPSLTYDGVSDSREGMVHIMEVRVKR